MNSGTVDAFLAGSQWQNWTREPIAADASTRTYFRLKSDDSNTVILMDAANQSDTTAAFVKITNLLKSSGLSSPTPYKTSEDNRFVILSDLGRIDFSQHLLQHPDQELLLYQSATSVTLTLRRLTTQGLPILDPDVAGKMAGITCEYYVENPKAQNLIETAIADAMARNCTARLVLSLRDFHAENLIWRPNASGLKRVGLLDFQDAFLAPEGYDLVSLLRDVRRDVSPPTQSATIKYFAQNAGLNCADFATQLATLAVQRNLRILGVFARLIIRDKKPKYAVFLPRVWRLICEDLQNPNLKELSKVVHANLPPPHDSRVPMS